MKIELTQTYEYMANQLYSHAQKLKGIGSFEDCQKLAENVAKVCQNERPQIENFAVAINWLNDDSKAEFETIQNSYLHDLVKYEPGSRYFSNLEFAQECGMNVPVLAKYVKLKARIDAKPSFLRSYLQYAYNEYYSPKKNYNRIDRMLKAYESIPVNTDKTESGLIVLRAL